MYEIWYIIVTCERFVLAESWLYMQQVKAYEVEHSGGVILGTIYLKKGKEARVRAGHPWVYAADIFDIEGEPEPGDIVDVVNAGGRFMARGYVNQNSQITVRILTRREEAIDEAFWEKRIYDAISYRDTVAKGASSKRLVFSEGDRIPGLIVDQYNDILVVQILSFGIEVRKELIVDTLTRLTGIDKVYERSDVRNRLLEGLEPRAGFMSKQFATETVIDENGFKMKVDVANGQKTGYFLDQRENRACIKEYVKDALVLDCFTHTGSFSVHAAGYGAQKVVAVDISDTAIEMAKTNLELNDPQCDCDLIEANVFDVLRSYEKDGTKFDVVILDPPAFTKSRSSVESAVRGYKDINLRGARILREGGYLITASCSHHMKEDVFIDVVGSALEDVGRSARLVEVRTQAKDHPILMGVPEAKYLKFLVLQVI